MIEMGAEGNKDTLEDSPPVNPDIQLFQISLPQMDVFITISIILFIASILGFAFESQIIKVTGLDHSSMISVSYIMQILGIWLLVWAFLNGKTKKGLKITGKYALYLNTVIEMTNRNFKIRELT